MTENKKISVIVPVFNVEKYLEKCIKSILNQTYKNIEVLIIDDGSTDGSSDLCDRLSETDERFTVLHKPNGGLSDARNAGLELATGDLISFVDSDDYIEPTFLETLCEALERTGADISSCRYKKVWEDGKSVSVGKDGLTREYTGDEPLAQYLYGEIVDPFVCNKLYTREIIGETRFINGIVGEDNPFNIEICKRCKKLVLLGFDFYCYLQKREGSIVTSGISQKKIDSVFRWNGVTEDCRVNYPELVKFSLRRQYLFYLGLYNSCMIERTGNSERKLVRAFVHKNIKQLINNPIMTLKEKNMAWLISYIPWLYNVIAYFYKKTK